MEEKTVESILREINPDLYEKKEKKEKKESKRVERIKHKNIRIKTPKIRRMVYRKGRTSTRPTITIKSRKAGPYRSIFFK